MVWKTAFNRKVVGKRIYLKLRSTKGLLANFKKFLGEIFPYESRNGKKGKVLSRRRLRNSEQSTFNDNV